MSCSSEAKPFAPPGRYPGNMVSCGDDTPDGLHELSNYDLVVNASAGDDPSARLIWSEQCSPNASDGSSDRRGSKKRPRASPPLSLVLENPTPELVEVVVSLSALVSPAHVVTGEPFAAGTLLRPDLPVGASPNLPHELGAAVRFVTLSASVPPRSCAQLCRTSPDADSAPGFVFKLASGGPHSSPDEWTGVVLGPPLACSGGLLRRGAALCTQGFGGSGHHRGPTAHHSADFACPAGTPLLAVFAGTVSALDDSRSVGGPHVDLLPEAGFLRLVRADGAVTAVYLHLARGSVRVRVGEVVAEGQELARSGDSGFSRGPHLHLHVERGPRWAAAAGGGGDGGAPAAGEAGEGGGEWNDSTPTVMWALRDEARGAVVPVAGHWYGERGWAPPVDDLEALRLALGLARAGPAGPAGGGAASEVPADSPAPDVPVGPLPLAKALELVRRSLLWCAAEPFPAAPAAGGAASSGAGDEGSTGSDEDELRAFPSTHTCLVANVLAASSLLLEGAASRFLHRGAFPPVYLACTFNFDRDDSSGELFSMEPAIAEHQEAARDEAAAFADVVFSQDPASRHDWLAFFRRTFVLQSRYELWEGGAFLENVATRPALLRRGVECLPVWSLSRTSLAEFEAAARAASAPAGCVAVFRVGPPDAEPFGVWFSWMFVGGHVLVADLQNGGVHASLRGAVEALAWDEPPREGEVFWAPLRRTA